MKPWAWYTYWYSFRSACKASWIDSTPDSTQRLASTCMGPTCMISCLLCLLLENTNAQKTIVLLQLTVLYAIGREFYFNFASTACTYVHYTSPLIDLIGQQLLQYDLVYKSQGSKLQSDTWQNPVIMCTCPIIACVSQTFCRSIHVELARDRYIGVSYSSTSKSLIRVLVAQNKKCGQWKWSRITNCLVAIHSM